MPLGALSYATYITPSVSLFAYFLILDEILQYSSITNSQSIVTSPVIGFTYSAVQRSIELGRLRGPCLSQRDLSSWNLQTFAPGGYYYAILIYKSQTTDCLDYGLGGRRYR